MHYATDGPSSSDDGPWHYGDVQDALQRATKEDKGDTLLATEKNSNKTECLNYKGEWVNAQ